MPPSPSPRWTTTAVALVAVLAAAGGWIAAKTLARQSASTPSEPHVIAATSHALASSLKPSATSDATFAECWQNIALEPPTSARTTRMTAMIGELAQHDPAQAMALVAAEQNLWLRRQLRDAALRGWASIAPDDALAWTMTLRENDNRPAIAAVLLGAAAHPDSAIRLTQQLCAQSPALATDYGRALVDALGAQGAFADAVRFANSGTAANREAWLNAAFIQWGQNQPQQALAACSGIDNAALRQTAIDGLFLGWSQADPAGLASYALQLTDERERATGLSQALTQWIDHDPAAASHWLDRFEPRPEFDSGMLMLATLPTLIAKRPEVAVDWARSIADPAIQAGALRTIAQQWAERDIAGAQRFAANSGPLSAQEHTAWEEGINLAQHPGADIGRVVPATGDPRGAN